MIIPIKYPLLFPDVMTSGPTPPAANVAVPREPSAAEMATEFVDDISEVIDEPTVVVEKTEPTVETKAEPKSEVEPGKKVVTFFAKDHKAEPKAEPTAASAVAPVVKPTEAVKIAPEIKPITPITPSSATPKTRDYSSFSPEEAAVLKQMSNEAFDYTSRILKERKELEPLRNSSFLQHPEAYQLDPAYKTIQEDAQYLNAEAQYWESQLLAISEGKPWAPLVSWKNGQPVLGAEQQPTELAKIQVTKCMNQCAYGAQQAGTKLQQFTSGYQQRVQADNGLIQQECAKRFSWVADPKILDATVNVEGVGDQTIKDIRKDFINIFPPYMRNTTGVDVSAHLWVAMQIQQQKIRELENGKHVAEVKKEEVLLAEPSSTNRQAPAGKQINGVTEFSLEGMPE